MQSYRFTYPMPINFISQRTPDHDATWRQRPYRLRSTHRNQRWALGASPRCDISGWHRRSTRRCLHRWWGKVAPENRHGVRRVAEEHEGYWCGESPTSMANEKIMWMTNGRGYGCGSVRLHTPGCSDPNKKNRSVELFGCLPSHWLVLDPSQCLIT